jgi:transcriptional regulator with XRE-family HTH domain
MAKRYPRRPKENPFYISIKPEGQNIKRLGPMSEADFWIEDLGDDLQPIHTSADPTFEEVGQLLRQRRKELGLLQKTVARMADVSPSTMVDIELGKTKASQATLKHIAKVMGSYFDGPIPSRRRKNPDVDVFEEVDEDHYRMFHGVPPSEVIDQEVWVPGGMVLIGTGKDVGYGISNPESFKDGLYVHDFGPGVKIYRRPRSGERADKTWRSFPSQLTNLGWNLGFTYNAGGTDGPMKEVKGSRNKYLAVTPNRKTLVVVDGVGVLYLMEGGAMRVDDWIRD